MIANWICTFCSSRPNPRDYRCFPAALLFRHLDLRIEMPDALIGFLLHPFAVIAHVLRQPCRALPTDVGRALPSCVRVYRAHTRKLRRNFNHRLVNHNRNRVQVMRMGFQSQSLRLQRNRAAAREGIEQRRRIAIGRFENFSLCFRQNLLVIAVFPLDQPGQDVKQALAFLPLRLFGRKLFGMAGWIIHQRRPDHRTGGCKRTTRPPKVERAGMPVTDGFLAGRFCIDGFQRESHFDKFFLRGHGERTPYTGQNLVFTVSVLKFDTNIICPSMYRKNGVSTQETPPTD